MPDEKKDNDKDNDAGQPRAAKRTTICPHCGGRKTVAVGTEDVPCATCGATGRVETP